ncbi:glycoside hydrolase family 3 protein [Periconia macrospinosa]|uniref:beta-glucosidase n=1 Tax=Periconia macrospinosa TaxID=97972 RepID=A0A2V1DZS1_9PLEO|nr:glycoside hydrolase family 3 protein [Periconia macrospinosa]
MRMVFNVRAFSPTITIIIALMKQTILTVVAVTSLVQAYGFESSWDVAHDKTKSALVKLNLTEKVGIVTDITWEGGPCVGNAYATGSIKHPSLCRQNSPLEIRFATPVTAFPARINAGLTWDRSLMNARGAALGTEAKGLGINSSRDQSPAGNSVVMQKTIQGIQDSGVQAYAKGYIGNEQEYNRSTISSNINDRTLNELYLWPFVDAVKANVASVMCSYNNIESQWDMGI